MRYSRFMYQYRFFFIYLYNILLTLYPAENFLTEIQVITLPQLGTNQLRFTSHE